MFLMGFYMVNLCKATYNIEFAQDAELNFDIGGTG